MKESNRLPIEYQKLDYMESNGKQWIDTGINGNSNYILESCQYVRDMGNASILGSRQESGGGRCYLLSLYGGNYHLGLDGDNFTTYAASDGFDVLKYDGSTSYKKLYVNGNLILSINKEVSTSYNFYLFAANNFGSPQRFITMQLKYLIIKNINNIPLRHFIPCYRRHDHAIGLYDKISKQFFTSESNVSFIAGNEVY